MFGKRWRGSINIVCPKCNSILRGATKEMIGDIGVCPKCKSEFVIEEPGKKANDESWKEQAVPILEELSVMWKTKANSEKDRNQRKYLNNFVNRAKLFLKGLKMIHKIVILWTGIGVICLMCLFPPWVRTFSFEGTYSKRLLGYFFILIPPYGSVEIDLSRLGIQCGIVGLITIGLLYSLKDRK